MIEPVARHPLTEVDRRGAGFTGLHARQALFEEKWAEQPLGDGRRAGKYANAFLVALRLATSELCGVDGSEGGAFQWGRVHNIELDLDSHPNFGHGAIARAE